MSKKRIIIVDDEAYVTTTLAAKLRAAGYDVTTASNGEEAFELATINPPDVLITDYQMPIMSGFEMSVKLKEQLSTSHIPVLMLTSRGHLLSETELARTNIKLMLAKPFSARELLSKVNGLLSTIAIASV